ncbi:MAG TPA: hypothetical protein VH679_05610 [Vicinamibacterales bacterium]|jgi:hypothetical protein
MFERHTSRPISRARFVRRMARQGAIAAAIVGVSLGFGMWGYSRYEGLAWRDSFLNAAMLLGGMGPVNPPKTDAGKLFAGVYALYAGLIFIVTAGLLLAPVVHRVLHRFHFGE